MTINIVLKALAPEAPYNDELVCHTIESTPFMLYGLWLKSQKYFWQSPGDWQVARSLLAREGASLLMPCGQQIVNAIDRLYILTAASLQGTTYYVSGTGTAEDPYIYDPPLVQAPEPTIGVLPGLLAMQSNQIEAWWNLLNGSPSADYPDNRSFRDQLEAMRALLETTEADSDELEELLNLILLALA